MVSELAKQISTIERSLGECMIETAFSILRVWMNELGENNPYEGAFNTIRTRYQANFTKWLNVEDPNSEKELNELTGDAYQLADAVYADIRLKRGLSPQMHGFNPNAPQSVMNYFQNCVHMTTRDLDWFSEVLRDENRIGLAVVAITALERNIRECFSVDAFIALIGGMTADNEIIANHCMTNALTLLIRYDVRIDFFPQVQNAFCDAIQAKEELNDRLFSVLCAWISLSQKNLLEEYAMGMQAYSWLPESLQKLIDSSGLNDNYDLFAQWAPKEDKEYNAELIRMLPDTWLASILINGNEQRERQLAHVCISTGYRDYMWNYPQVAEPIYRNKLRDGSEEPIDYINYGHCLLLKGDRMMAYENYKQARQLCGSLRDFYDLFRPDRRYLIDHGVPLEYVYALEDNLING